MKEVYDYGLTVYYDSKFLVKFEKHNNSTKEIYIEVKDGKFYIVTHINGVQTNKKQVVLSELNEKIEMI